MQRAPLHLLPLLLLTLAACSSSSTDAPPEPEVTEPRTREPETTRAEPEGTTPQPTKAPPASPPLGPPDGARVIRPLGPGILNCIEMYSACTPDPAGGPPTCTSAPYHLDCGRSGHVPGSTETLYCDCT